MAKAVSHSPEEISDGNAVTCDCGQKPNCSMETIHEIPSSLPNQQLLSIDVELWLLAEERAQEILYTIQPNVISEVNRKDIINYLQQLIGGFYESEVQLFAFGSVPLKTYLPDGDVDLTVLSHETSEEDLATLVCTILESEADSEYQVKDVQHIRAQVQVVKCTVKHIAVDISFNQMAGLYALRFLEQVDQLVGKNHLFKRSIILIKAWCYYESRILGAHHGLLSTYAVEILVLYIINCFHSSVRGPLEVLYRFLDYYSTFDWDTHYVSIEGPKPLSSLPEIVETPDCERGEFLLSKELLRSYRDMCSPPVKASETATHEFQTKHLNILDPLRNDNNLGRSVSKGNLHRIRFALSFGARKLKEILTLPGESMGAALEKFFMNTLDRNGKGQRPDVEVPVPAFGTGRSEESDLRGDIGSYFGALQFVQFYRNYAIPLTAHTSTPSSPSQQNWSMFYPMGTNVYVPTQTLYHTDASLATYCLEENVISRGTGTYIPNVTHNSYWDLRPRVTRPRRFPYTYHNVSPRSPQRYQPAEFHSEADMNGNSRLFESSGEDFTILPGFFYTGASEAHKSVLLTEKAMNSSSSQLNFELSNEEFPVLSSTHKTNSSESQECIQLTEQVRNFSLSQPCFELSNEEFPRLPSIRKTSPSEASESAQLTQQARNSSSYEMNIELSNEEFPILPSTRKTSPSEVPKSGQLTEQVRSSSLPQLNIQLSNEEFPLLPSIHKTSSSKASKSHQLTEQARSSSLSQLNIGVSKAEFPVLPSIRKSSPPEALQSAHLTDKARNSSSSQLNIELPNKEFPLLPSIDKTRPTEMQKSVQLTDPARNSSSSPLCIEFGAYMNSQPLTKMSLSTKDEKKDSGVSSSGGTMLVVPVAVDRKDEFPEGDDKSWIDSI